MLYYFPTMAIEKFHAEITFPRGEMERILRWAWNESSPDERIMVYLVETRRKVSIYMTGEPISDGFAYLLQVFGAKVKRVAGPRPFKIFTNP